VPGRLSGIRIAIFSQGSAFKPALVPKGTDALLYNVQTRARTRQARITQFLELDKTVPLEAFAVGLGTVDVPVVELAFPATASTVPHLASYISGNARLVEEALVGSKASLMRVALVGQYDGLK
jgi:hypothetical protein